jgi:hypothetical protein
MPCDNVCGACRHWAPDPRYQVSPAGQCREAPPAGGFHPSETRYPLVYADFPACARWRARAEGEPPALISEAEIKAHARLAGLGMDFGVAGTADEVWP